MSHMSRRTAHQSGLSLLLLLLLWCIVPFIDLGETQTPLHWLNKELLLTAKSSFPSVISTTDRPSLTLWAFVFFLHYCNFY